MENLHNTTCGLQYYITGGTSGYRWDPMMYNHPLACLTHHYRYCTVLYLPKLRLQSDIICIQSERQILPSKRSPTAPDRKDERKREEPRTGQSMATGAKNNIAYTGGRGKRGGERKETHTTADHIRQLVACERGTQHPLPEGCACIAIIIVLYVWSDY